MSLIRPISVALLTVCLFLPVPSRAQTQASSAQPPQGGQREFAGLKFGVGLSFTWDVVDRERVEEAIIDSEGIVRVTKKNNALARIMLESHYFFPWRQRKDVGWGPFVAVQPGSEEIINALGAGIMFGFRRGESNQSFNLGVGYSVDPSTKILGDGFVENEPAPPGETVVRFQTRDQGGFLFLASFSWQ